MPKVGVSPSSASSNGKQAPLKKLGEGVQEPRRDGEINAIAPQLRHLVVDLDSLVPDPDNARLHPEVNMAAIKDSLSRYGQVVPLVVRAANRVIVAGNGRWQAAKELGWTKIAANVQEMTEVEAVGYGIADNRTAELATWDLEVLPRLAALQAEAGQSVVGWTLDDLKVLRENAYSYPDEGLIGRAALTGGAGDIVPDAAAWAEELLKNEKEEWWPLWQGMPEFIQRDLIYRTILVHFACQEDVDEFMRTIDQQATDEAKFVWFPKAEIVSEKDKRWIHASLVKRG